MVRTVCAPLVRDLCACHPSSLICHTLLFAASSLRRSLQGKTRDVAVCRAKRQPPAHYWSRGLWLTPACVRHLAGKHVALLTSAVLLMNNTAGLATALRGDCRPCRQTPAAAAGRQQVQLYVVRQMPFPDDRCATLRGTAFPAPAGSWRLSKTQSKCIRPRRVPPPSAGDEST